MYKKISHVDKKVLTPSDSKLSKLTKDDIDKHYNKPTRGYVVISDESGKVLETPNLVLLGGREFLAQKLADTYSISNVPNSTIDLSNFKIRYFGIGSGGADTSATPSKIGPFDNETDLNLPGKFADISLDNDTTPVMDLRYQYIHDGKLKKIQSDIGGEIEIISEAHDILINGEEITIEAYTTIKFTLIIRSDELYKETSELGPFAFNEAALYAVEYESNVLSTDGLFYDAPAQTDNTELSRYTPNKRCFARFTTLTKWLEVNDSLKIEWYILV